jgi:hypothetical protein
MRTGRRPRMKDSLRPQVRFFCCAPTNASRVFTQPGSHSVIRRCLPDVRFARKRTVLACPNLPTPTVTSASFYCRRIRQPSVRLVETSVYCVYAA